jgi:hypothetical protein
MSADSSLAPSVDIAAAPEEDGRYNVVGLAHSLRKLRAAVGNLTALQHSHDEVAGRLRDLEETSTRRGEALTALRRQLVERDARVAFLELEIERRRSLTAPSARLASAREQEQSAADAAAVHLLFLPTAGAYVVEEGTGPPPPQGATVEVRQIRYTVAKHGASPLPHDDRRCAYLL